eukprot:6209599-Pleurochrysis_carterae.AAC.1
MVTTEHLGFCRRIQCSSCRYARHWHSARREAFAAPATAVAMARGNPYELGGQIPQPELSRGDAPVSLVNQILEAQRRNKDEWVFLSQWAGYDTPTIQHELGGQITPP